MRNILPALILSLSCSVFAQNSTDKLIQEAQAAPTLEKNLRVLTDEVGGRGPGTPAMERAVQWGMEAVKAAGADDVSSDPVPMPAHWVEGSAQGGGALP